MVGNSHRRDVYGVCERGRAQLYRTNLLPCSWTSLQRVFESSLHEDLTMDQEREICDEMTIEDPVTGKPRYFVDSENEVTDLCRRPILTDDEEDPDKDK